MSNLSTKPINLYFFDSYLIGGNSIRISIFSEFKDVICCEQLHTINTTISITPQRNLFSYLVDHLYIFTFILPNLFMESLFKNLSKRKIFTNWAKKKILRILYFGKSLKKGKKYFKLNISFRLYDNVQKTF